MSEPFLAEIKIVGFNFPPRGWAQCDGQILPINQNQALFSLLGTTYGGDGRTNFALPDLRGRAPMHESSGFSLGSRAGSETEALTNAQMPQHTHAPRAGKAAGAGTDTPLGNYWGEEPGVAGYRTATDNINMNAAAVGSVGSGQWHNNMQPYVTLNFIIALQGIFPSRS
jgi:microcystin-dependent protein